MLTDYVTGSSATFVRNPEYWQNDPLNPENQLPYLDGCKWLIIPDLATRVSAMRTGKADILCSPALEWEDGEDLIRSNPELEYLRKNRGTPEAVQMIQDNPRFIVPFPPELDIILWAPRAASASIASKLSEAVFHEAAELDLHFALATMPRLLFEEAAHGMQWDQDHLTCLRACVMKPDHLDWIDKIYESLEKAANNAFTVTAPQ